MPGSMPGFAGFEDWVPIFMGGKQTDSNGKSHDGDELIEKAVKTFDPNTTNRPRFWVTLNTTNRLMDGSKDCAKLQRM